MVYLVDIIVQSRINSNQRRIVSPVEATKQCELRKRRSSRININVNVQCSYKRNNNSYQKEISKLYSIHVTLFIIALLSNKKIEWL